jgi:AcrR family transcriptional regulator
MSGNTELTDRRVRRTRKAIVTAFNELLFAKGYDAISAGDVAERADIGRSTFYQHYSGKDAVLAQSLSGLLQPIAHAGLDTAPDPRLAAAIEHIWSNRRLGRVLFTGGARPVMNRLLRDMIAEALSVNTNKHGSALPLSLLATHLAHGHLALLDEWLSGRHGCPASVVAASIDELARASIHRAAAPG